MYTCIHGAHNYALQNDSVIDDIITFGLYYNTGRVSGSKRVILNMRVNSLTLAKTLPEMYLYNSCWEKEKHYSTKILAKWYIIRCIVRFDTYGAAK